MAKLDVVKVKVWGPGGWMAACRRRGGRVAVVKSEGGDRLVCVVG